MISNKLRKIKISPEHVFMTSVMIVNVGNYLYNFLLARILGPELFADAAIIITFLLILSFVAMAFQLTTAKFAVVFRVKTYKRFVSSMYKTALVLGIPLGILIAVFSSQLQLIFQTTSASIFMIFGIGVPVYFIMSINRGGFQGKKEFKSLSITYQTEMLSKLLVTFALLLFFGIEDITIIAVGILVSLFFGLFPFNLKLFSLQINTRIREVYKKQIKTFFIITAFYEFTQIIINNSDVLLVKHYFDSYDAGLYASLALIGRMVYFMTWMYVMLLLPKVIHLKKEGKETSGILFTYISYIFLVLVVLVAGCVLFPEVFIRVLFGEQYLGIASLLWKYALATAIFSIANIFSYYYLSLDKYIPVIISCLFALLQIVLIVWFHNSLEQVLDVQIFTMIVLLLIQIMFYITTAAAKKRRIR